LKPGQDYKFTVAATTPTGVTPISEESNTVRARDTVGPLDIAAHAAITKVWIPSRPYREQGLVWYKQHEEIVNKVIIYLVLVIIAMKLWYSLHDSLMPQYHPEAITSKTDPVPTNEVEQAARRKVIDDRKTNAHLAMSVTSPSGSPMSSPPMTPSTPARPSTTVFPSASSIPPATPTAPPQEAAPIVAAPFEAPPMDDDDDGTMIVKTKPEVKRTAASPTAPKAGAGFGLKSPAKTGGTGDFSILANIQAQMNNGKINGTPTTPSGVPVKKSLDELNKTPSAGLKASIAAAVEAANAVPNDPIIPPSSPIPRGAATSPMTPMTPAAPSPITTPNTSRRDSDKIQNRMQPRPCDTTEVFNNLTQGMPPACRCLFLATFPLLMIEIMDDNDEYRSTIIIY
jgi:hypothetical protein